jgi:hypothetical protein
MKKARQNKKLKPGSGSIRTAKALSSGRTTVTSGGYGERTDTAHESQCHDPRRFGKLACILFAISTFGA